MKKIITLCCFLLLNTAYAQLIAIDDVVVARADNPGAATGNGDRVFLNDYFNGVPITFPDFVISGLFTVDATVPDPSGFLTLDPGGFVHVAVNTPEGIYQITYEICETANPSNCDTAVIEIRVFPATLNVGSGSSEISVSASNANGVVAADCGGDICITDAFCVDLNTGTIPPLTLTANYTVVGETTSYGVRDIDFNPPFQFSDTVDDTPLNIDDEWNGPLPLEFEFEFYGENFTECMLSTNGAVSFHPADAAPGQTHFWTPAAGALIPNNSDPCLRDGNIFGAVHDMYPLATNAAPPIDANSFKTAYAVKGEAPFRVFVFSFYNVGQFDCWGGARTSQMIMFYETTNIIETYIFQKDICTSWAGGRAAIGIQNRDGTEGISPPGRNTGEWNVDFLSGGEAYQFFPDGGITGSSSTVTSLQWFDEDGNEIAPDDPANPTELTVAPSETTTYVAQVTYTDALTTDVFIAYKPITVVVQPTPVVTVTPSADTCPGGDAIFTISGSEGDEVEFILNNGPIDTVILDSSGEHVITINGVTTTQTIELISANNINSVCGDTFSLIETINVVAVPVVTLTSNSPICEGEDAVFTLEGNAGDEVAYHINTDATQMLVLDASGEATVTIPGVLADQSITLETINNPTTGCNGPLGATDTVVVNPLPVVTLVSNVSTCAGADAVFTITGTPGDTVNYTINGGGTQSITLDGSGNGVVTLLAVTTTQTILLESVENPTTGCHDVLNHTDTVTITTVPAVSLTTNSSICIGADAIFTLVGTPGNEVDYTVDGGVTTQTITLDASGGADVIVPGATTSETISLIYVRDLVTGCEGAINDSVTINISPTPTVALSPTSSICSGDDAVFTLMGDAGDIVTYNINGGGTQSVTLDASGEGFVTVMAATANQTITLESITNPTTTCGDVLNDTETIAIVALPVPVALVSNVNTCLGDDAVFTITGTPGDIVNYTINGGGTQSITLDGSGNGVVTLLAVTATQTILLELVANPTTGCSTVLSDTDTVAIIALPTLTLSSNMEGCPGDDAVFTITGTAGNDVEYTLDGGLTTQNVILDGSGIGTVVVSAAAANQTIELISVNDPLTTCTASVVDTETYVVNPLPTVIAPSSLIVCDDNVPDGVTEMDLTVKSSEISGGNTNYSVTYYNNLADAEAGTPEVMPSSSAYMGADAEVVFVRVEDATTGCFDTTTLTLTVVSAPAANTPPALHYCDPDNDGLGIFDLASTIPDITTDPALEVTFHLTYQNAIDDILPQSSPLSNVMGQVIYVRVDYNGATTDCPTIVELQLVIDPTPEIENNPEPYVLCDNDGVADGMTEFDLITVNSEILNGLNSANYTVSYYVDVADADIGVTAATYIATPGAYFNTVGPNQTIGVRVEDNITACYTATTLDLIVNPLPIPVVTPEALLFEICDDSLDNDGYAVFDLTEQDAIITGGNSSWSVNYFETMADVTVNNPIPDFTAYTNRSIGGLPHNPQTIFVTVSETANGIDCYAVSALTLVVNTLPTPNPVLLNMALCDDNNIGDLEEEFDITANEAAMLNAFDETVSYHLTMADAEAGSDQIPNPTTYTNQSPTQTIYVRVTNTGDPADPLDNGTGCYTVVMFDIIVNPLPVVSPVDDIIVCEINTDFEYDFDLTQREDDILNGQSRTEFSVTYYTSQAAASAGTGEIVNPTAFNNGLINPREIFVNIANTTTGCDIASVSFFVEVQLEPQVNPDMVAIDATLCDDNIEFDGNTGNDSVQFDLSLYNPEVLDGQDPANFTVSYYESFAAAETGLVANQLPFIYENIANPQVVYVRVDNDTNPNDMCYAIDTMILNVDPLPVVNLDDSFILCLNTNGTAVVGSPVIDTGLSIANYTFEWTETSAPSVVLGTDSYYEAVQGGTYSVLVTNNTTGCSTALNDLNTITTVIESTSPTIDATVLTDAFAAEHIIEVTASGAGAIAYEFSLDNGVFESNGTNTYIFQDVSEGEHIITVRDINGCGEAETTVMVMDYPLYFTPNNDGHNDTWNIKGIADQLDAVIYIFDRYGKLVKHLSPNGPGWDGTLNSEKLPTSDYWFVVEYREPGSGLGSPKKEFKAHFSLKR